MPHPSPEPAPTPSIRPIEAPAAVNREAAGLAAPSASAWQPASASGPTEIVIRPKGLRHGVWEAPKWAFWTVAAMLIAAAAFYAAARLGLLRHKAR